MHNQDWVDSYTLGPALAVLGGVVSYIQRMRTKRSMIFSLAELIGECAISGFVGILTALICVANGLGVELSAALTGIAGHMGSRALFLLERAISRRLNVPEDL